MHITCFWPLLPTFLVHSKHTRQRLSFLLFFWEKLFFLMIVSSPSYPTPFFVLFFSFFLFVGRRSATLHSKFFFYKTKTCFVWVSCIPKWSQDTLNMLSCIHTLHFRIGVILLVKFHQQHKKEALVNWQFEQRPNTCQCAKYMYHNKNAGHRYPKENNADI